jgi:hypothetical protein
VRGPGNSPERSYHYTIENDINFTVERTSKISVWFVNPFERHDKACMNRRVRSMNLHMIGLHLNSQGKKRLMQLIAERAGGGHTSGLSSIPIITDARASPFLA